MLIRFLYCRSAANAVLYGLRTTNAKGVVRDMSPVPIIGSRKMFESACAHSGLKHSHNSCVLSYSEGSADIGLERQRRHLARFAEILRGGLPEARVPSYGVAHPGYDGTDSHLFQSKVDLLTHTQLPVWSFTASEIDFLNTWRRFTNITEGMTDPDDPWVRRFLAPVPDRLAFEHRREFREIDMDLSALAGDGWIWTADDLHRAFAARDCEVVGSDSVSVTVRNRDGVVFRYVGGKYARGFDFQQIVDARNTEPTRNPKVVKREAEALKIKFAYLERERRAYFARRFGTETLVSVSRVHKRLLGAYPGTGPRTRILDHCERDGRCGVPTMADHTVEAGVFPRGISGNYDADDQVARPVAKALSIHEVHHEHDQNDHGVDRLFRIGRQRRLFTDAIFRGIGQALVRSGGSLERMREAAVGALECAEEMLGTIERLSHEGRGGRLRRGLGRCLERSRHACDDARRAIRWHRTQADPVAGLRDPNTGALPISLIPRQRPNVEFEQEV